MLLSAHTPQSSRAAWQTHGGVCYVGRVECLFPSTGGLDCSAHSHTHTHTHTHRHTHTHTHTWTHTWFKVKGGTHWVKGERHRRDPHVFYLNSKSTFFTQRGGKDCLPPPFCFAYVFFPRRRSSSRHDTHMHTHSHQRYFCVICNPSVGVCVYLTVYKAPRSPALSLARIQTQPANDQSVQKPMRPFIS